MPTLRLEIHDPVDIDAGELPAVFVVASESRIIGRDPTADIVVASTSVSLRHGILTPDGDAFRYTDLHSTNGSVRVRDGHAEPCPAGVALPLADGDRLLLGDSAAPVVIELTVEPSRQDTRPSMQRTIVARKALTDLLAPVPHAGPNRVAELAATTARAMTVADAPALVAVALDVLQWALPGVATRGVALWGPGLSAEAGAPLPQALRELALRGGLDAAELFVEGGDMPLPMTQSIAVHATRAALVVPLLVQGVSWGVAFASSPLGADAFPPDAVDIFAMVGPLLGLAASELSRRLLAVAATPQVSPPGDGAPPGIAPRFVEVLQLARQVAPTDVPVLIHGETGSGKEVLARYLHGASRRSHKPFVAFNCAAIPENLIESELFGHVRGAFTSAHADRRGLFEEADGGTLFLDEIGEMPLVMQAKLLRVLQEGEVRRVGAQKSIRVDVRVISATHRDLQALAAHGAFRSDLMYRLNAVTLTLPPLRERPEDIPLLAHLFLQRAAERTGKAFPGFSPEALWALSLHRYPGNVRELDNEILRAAALTPTGVAIPADVFSPRVREAAPAAMAPPSGRVMPLRDVVARAERAAIEAALAETRGNVTEAARLLDVTRPGLYKVMERLGLK